MFNEEQHDTASRILKKLYGYLRLRGMYESRTKLCEEAWGFTSEEEVINLETVEAHINDMDAAPLIVGMDKRWLR